MDKLKQLILDEVNYEENKDESVRGKDWTNDYKEGFIDGLKRALELINYNDAQ